MTTSTVIYEGNLHTMAKHTASGNSVETDAPVDNNGRGMAFSPSDLTATSLASCMMTIMGIAAEKRGIMIEQMNAEVYKVMASEPRRIIEIKVNLTVKVDSDEPRIREVLRHAALNCPVAHSLHPDIKQDVHFNFL